MQQVASFIKSFERDTSEQTESTILAKEIYTHFGKSSGGRIYPLFSNPRYTHRQIKDAWRTYQNCEVKTLNYFLGILNRTK